MKSNNIHGALFGVAIGDALGVPVEFRTREYLNSNPVIDMIEFGTHNQAKGTWSDDSSLTFCLAEMICSGYDLKNLANRFINWRDYAYWTANSVVFDIGNATQIAIQNLKNGIEPLEAGGKNIGSNGNGSLMRILPLAFYIKHFDIKKRFQITKEVSSLTHAHDLSIIACFIYVEFALEIIKGIPKFEAFKNMQKTVQDFFANDNIVAGEDLVKFQRIFEIGKNSDVKEFNDLIEAQIASTGYVADSLEASIWCVLNSNSYEETVLKAVNLGSDTDTTAAIAGGLAGILYGYESIPKKWINSIAKKEKIFDLCNRLGEKLKESNDLF